MNHTVSRRALIGALGAGALLPAFASGQNFPASIIPTGSRDLWNWVRAQLVLDPAIAWLDMAGSGPILRAVMVREYRSRERQSQNFHRYQASVLEPDALARHLAGIAAFIGAAPDEVAFTTGSAAGLAVVARGLDLQPEDEVLLSRHERSAVVGPWRVEAARRGIRLVEIPEGAVATAPEEIVGRYAGAITPRTKAVLVSHVRASDGVLMPVREICALARGNGIVSIVDGALGPGHVDVDVDQLGCDAYAAALHRWMGASWGIGALYVRRDVQARVWPVTQDAPGAAGAQPRYGAQARHLGPAIEGVAIALEFQQAVSRARIGTRIRELAAYLRLQLQGVTGLEILSPSHPSLATGVVSVRVPGRSATEVVRSLAEQDGIVAGDVSRDLGLEAVRISLHAGTEHAELDRCVNGLRRQV